LPDKQIERPLGLDGRKIDRHGPRFPIRKGQAGVALTVLLVVGAAGYIALDERPFRSPPTVAISTPETVSGNQQAGPSTGQAAAAYPPSSPGGPSIIKIDPSATPAGNVIVV